jgi:hypothetical protein
MAGIAILAANQHFTNKPLPYMRVFLQPFGSPECDAMDGKHLVVLAAGIC